jgi:divalent metal cation (Fe/Co/Zn/Cd) transporter
MNLPSCIHTASASSATSGRPVQARHRPAHRLGHLDRRRPAFWLDALSPAGALAGLATVAFGQPWDDPVAGLAITALICHVGWEVTTGVVHRLADGVVHRPARTRGRGALAPAA